MGSSLPKKCQKIKELKIKNVRQELRIIRDFINCYGICCDISCGDCTI